MSVLSGQSVRKAGDQLQLRQAGRVGRNYAVFFAGDPSLLPASLRSLFGGLSSPVRSSCPVGCLMGDRECGPSAPSLPCPLFQPSIHSSARERARAGHSLSAIAQSHPDYRQKVAKCAAYPTLACLPPCPARRYPTTYMVN